MARGWSPLQVLLGETVSRGEEGMPAHALEQPRAVSGVPGEVASMEPHPGKPVAPPSREMMGARDLWE